MPRSEKERLVHEPPFYTEFKPVGVRGPGLGQVRLSLDEFEAFRLADHKALSHEEASGLMEISRSTFTRLIEKARAKIADFVIHGKMLVIEGGKVHFKRNIVQCKGCGQMFKISIVEEISECPACHSKHLLNLAGGFGHGRCCVKKQLK